MKLLMETWRKFLSEEKSTEQNQNMRKAIFMAGAPGAGKSTVINRLGLKTLKIINPDDFYEPMLTKAGLGKNISKIKDDYISARDKLIAALGIDTEEKIKHEELEAAYAQAEEDANLKSLKKTYDDTRNKVSQQAKIFNQARNAAKEKQQSTMKAGESFIIDGTGGQFGVIRNQKKKLEELGYDVGMIFVDIPLETSLDRQKSRLEKGGRSLDAKSVEKSWNAVTKNREPYRELFGDSFFHIIATDEDVESSIASEGEKLSSFLGALEEDFQSKLKPRLIKQMKRLLTHGGNKDSGPFKEKPPIDYRGSAPPNAPGG
jgi:predicted kinase